MKNALPDRSILSIEFDWNFYSERKFVFRLFYLKRRYFSTRVTVHHSETCLPIIRMKLNESRRSAKTSNFVSVKFRLEFLVRSAKKSKRPAKLDRRFFLTIDRREYFLVSFDPIRVRRIFLFRRSKFDRRFDERSRWFDFPSTNFDVSPTEKKCF